VALLDRGKHVSLSLTSGGHKLHLACDRYEANISTLPADDFPTTPAVDGTIRIQVGGAVLKTAIEQVVFAAAPDDTRPVLAGVLLRLDTGTLTRVIWTLAPLLSRNKVMYISLTLICHLFLGCPHPHPGTRRQRAFPP
jgi:DNA polymerase III beta subunit, central domain